MAKPGVNVTFASACRNYFASILITFLIQRLDGIPGITDLTLPSLLKAIKQSAHFFTSATATSPTKPSSAVSTNLTASGLSCARSSSAFRRTPVLVCGQFLGCSALSVTGLIACNCAIVKLVSLPTKPVIVKITPPDDGELPVDDDALELEDAGAIDFTYSAELA